MSWVIITQSKLILISNEPLVFLRGFYFLFLGPFCCCELHDFALAPFILLCTHMFPSEVILIKAWKLSLLSLPFPHHPSHVSTWTAVFLVPLGRYILRSCWSRQTAKRCSLGMINKSGEIPLLTLKVVSMINGFLQSIVYVQHMCWALKLTDVNTHDINTLLPIWKRGACLEMLWNCEKRPHPSRESWRQGIRSFANCKAYIVILVFLFGHNIF